MRKVLGVSHPKHFSGIAYDVNAAFEATGDGLHETQQYLVELLARRVKVSNVLRPYILELSLCFRFSSTRARTISVVTGSGMRDGR